MHDPIQQEERSRILVADDDETVRMLASECLGQLGFSVFEARDGQEAIGMVEQLDPALVILDVLMPGLDGYRTCRTIRAMPRFENLPILMMTALEDEEAVNAAFDAGASEYTVKPINWVVESYRLRSMIRFAKNQREVFLARQEWERTFDAMRDSIVIYDANLCVVQANAAAYRAVAWPDLKGAEGVSCRAFQECDAAWCDICPTKKALATGKAQQAKLVDGKRKKTYLVSSYPIFDKDGTVSRVISTSKDITAREHMEGELAHARKLNAIGTLSSGLAHDFNNLLQIIAGNADIASLDAGDNGELAHCLREIKDATQRGRDMIQQLLVLGRGGEEQGKTALCLNAVVEKLLSLIRRTLPANIDLTLELAPRLDVVRANQSQLEQVVVNLATNACQAMPTGGRLLIRTENVELDAEAAESFVDIGPGRYVRMVVRDTGCGMDAQTLDRIFEPFFTTKEPEKGTGLGLASVYGIVHRHDGTILCESTVGEGSSFEIYLPVLTDGESHPASGM